MKILKIIHGYPPNYNAGSEVYSQSIVNELKKKHEITVFTREENVYEKDFEFKKEQKDDIDFLYVNIARGKDGYNHNIVNKKFAASLKEIKPEIAHIGHLNHLSIGIVDELKKQNIPILYTLHDFWLMCPRGQFLQRNFDGEKLYSLCTKQTDEKCAKNCYSMYCSGTETHETDLKYWESWVNHRMVDIKNTVSKIDLFHAPSKYLMNRYIEDFDIPKEKIFYLDYGFPLDYLKPVEDKNNEMFIFGYIGTHIPSKGIELLIKAFTKIQIPAKLKIFGRELGQNTQALKNLAQSSINEIEFCGEYINENIAKKVFSKVDAIVVPSIWGENSPLVIHEAQACKIPVITANFGGMKEYVAHKVNGLLFEHRNMESLFTEMKFALQNPEKMKKYGEKAYLYSENGKIPNIKEHCEALEKKYMQLLKNKDEQ